jgi:hypothetical protein
VRICSILRNEDLSLSAQKKITLILVVSFDNHGVIFFFYRKLLHTIFEYKQQNKKMKVLNISWLFDDLKIWNCTANN